MSKYTLITLGLGVIIILLFNIFISEPQFKTLEERIEFLEESGKYSEANDLYKKILPLDSLNEKLHYSYISNYFRLPTQEDSLTIKLQYFNYSSKGNPDLTDIGFYGLGLITSYKNEPKEALEYFTKINNKNLKYLNNSKGWCLMMIDKSIDAEACFRKEIELNGNKEAAFNNLAKLFKRTGSTDKLRALLKNQEADLYIDDDVRREFYFMEANFPGYYKAITDDAMKSTNRYGFIAALFILIIWVIYLRKLDLYEKEKWTVVVITVLLGILFAHGTFLLHDFNGLILGNSLTGEIWNDFFYSIFGIGAIEEFIKITPLLLLLMFTNEINEPIDYIKYASLSAVGFAFSENLLYFESDALSIIPGRALLCVVSHMFYSSVIAYGIMLSQYKAHRFPILTFAISFLIASIFHGFYDFWLINESVSSFSKISFLFFFITTLGWIMLVNNCLSNSPFFDKEKIINASRLRDYLFSGLISIFIIQFILISIQQGPASGNVVLLKETTFGLIVLPLIVKTMGNLTILKNYWFHNLSLTRNIFFEHLIDKRIRLISIQKDKIRSIPEFIYGKVIERKLISNDPNWFLVELDQPLLYEKDLIIKVLLSPKELSRQARQQKSIKVYCLIVNDITLLEKEILDLHSFSPGGSLMIYIDEN